MIKTISKWNSATGLWEQTGRVVCKNKHKSNNWYTTEAPSRGSWRWEYVKPLEIVVAPKLLSVWSK